MKVILVEDVKALGKKGEMVNVSDGYARNMLFPKKLALEASAKNINDLKLKKAHDEKVAKEQLADARAFAEELAKAQVKVSVKVGEGGKVFGSVSSKEIAEAAKAQLDYTIPSTISINGYSLEITDEYDDTSVRKKIIDMCDAMNIDVSGPDGSLTLTTRATGANQKISVRSAGANDETVIYGKDAKITLGTQFTPADGFSYKANGAGIVIIGNDGFEMQIDVTDAKAGDSGIVRVEDAGYMVLQIGANEHQTLEMDFKEVSCQSLFLRNKEGVNQINACTQEGATELLKVLDDAIDKISAARSTLGAYQNRLDATRESLDVSEENLTDAMSRIMDTDMASEMTEYTSNNVLSQAATSMLSQANNRPQQIMSLLQS